MPFRDLAGQTFGRLVVVAPTRDSRGKHCWQCRCSCGKETRVGAHDLRAGKVVSCGCFLLERIREANTTHGHNKNNAQRSQEHRTWAAMLSRCRNPKDTKYERYGGRGIKVCPRWLKFENFLVDMGRKPSPKYTIERKDNDGNYELDNCRWATRKEQMRNTQRTRLLTHRGKTQCLQDWATELGVRYLTLWSRLARGWPVEQALSTKVG